MLSSSLAHLLYPEVCKTMQALSDLSLAKPSDNQALQVLSGFMSAFNADMNDVVISADPGREVADSGDLQYDLLDLFASIGRATQVAGKGWLLLVEEVQYLSREDLAALIMAIHHTTQEGLPVLLVGAGLPEVARLAGDAKPYAERLFLYIQTSNL